MSTVTRDAEGTVTGNTYDKYGSTNPVVRRLMAGFERTLDELCTKADPQSLLDVGAHEQLLERALEARHQPADDGIRRPVLVVGVAGDRPLGVARDGGAHTFSASRSSVCPLRPECAPVVGAWPVGCAPGS